MVCDDWQLSHSSVSFDCLGKLSENGNPRDTICCWIKVNYLKPYMA